MRNKKVLTLKKQNAMKTYPLLMGLFCLTLASCTKEYYTESTEEKTSIEMNIANHGAVGDGQQDCSEVINQLIAGLSASSGAVLVIPEGDFVLDNPIVINRNNITIKGANPGMRSNIDVKGISTLLGPGGGSKLILRNATAAIQIPTDQSVTGLEVENLLISGGTSNNGTGILMEGKNRDGRIHNIIGINLDYGIRANQSKGLAISDCWISEVKNSIELNEGEENRITNCQLGAQPAGVTCKAIAQSGLLFSGNHVYPDGTGNLVLENCDRANISNNNFKSYYTGILEVTGNSNLVNGNIFWLADAKENQLLDRGADYGVIRVSGNANMFSSNNITCEWGAVTNPVTVNATTGTGNRFSNCLIDNIGSERVFYINAATQVYNCVPQENVKVMKELPAIETTDEKVGYVIAYDDPAAIEDDDEQASCQWFKQIFTNGTILTPALLASSDLSPYKAIWIHTDRIGLEPGWSHLPAALTSEAALNALTNYYKAGGNLFLSNHATQLIVALGRTERAPGIYGNGEGGEGSDVWTINANIGLQYDQSAHPVFEGLEISNQFPHPTFPLIGPGKREDHNCMWDLNSYGFPALYPDKNNPVDAFQDENNATVLATWGHVTDWCCAGMVEFKPTADYQGTCIAIGLAAYEWNQNSGKNEYQYDIERMTRNALLYLSRK